MGRDLHLFLVTQPFVPCTFCVVLVNCAHNRDACPWRTLTLNKCFCLTFIVICSFKRIRTETKRVSYVLCASHDISRIDPFVYLTSFKRRNNGEGEVFPILCFGSSWNTFRALRAIRLVYLVCDRRDSQLKKVFPPKIVAHGALCLEA